MKDAEELFKTTLPVRLAPLGIPTATSRRSPSPLNSPGFKVVFVQKVILFDNSYFFLTSCCWISKVGVIVLSYKCQESSRFGKQFTAKRCRLTKCEIITILQTCGLPSWVIDWFLGLRKLKENAWPGKQENFFRQLPKKQQRGFLKVQWRPSF